MEYVINLDKRSDRWEKFQKNNGNLFRVSAVENINAPACGCLNPHLKILKIAKERQLEYVIIFEDDAVLRKNVQSLHEQINNLDQKEKWDILLFSINYGAHLFYTFMGKLCDETYFLRVNQFFTGSYCMAISSRSFDRLIDMMESRKEEDIDVDVEIYSQLCDDGNVFLTIPFLAEVLSNDRSDIRPDDTSDYLENVLWCEKVLLINNNICK